MIFAIADYLAGMLVGVATALTVRLVVWHGMDMVVAMLVGMILGIVIHLILGLVVAPFIGMFQAMIPSSLIGMYGGAFFGMRDAMGAGSPAIGANLAVGALFGGIVVAGISYYDRVLRGEVVDTSERSN